MPCKVISLENGGSMIACLRTPAPTFARCVVCGQYAPFLCDFEVAPGKTCDAPLCGRCRYNMGVKDYCPEHAGLASRQPVAQD